jgi:phospholipase C
VDHSITDISSVLRFVEDNWLSGQRIGQGSFDALANSITQMFNFRAERNDGQLFLNSTTGTPLSGQNAQ